MIKTKTKKRGNNKMTYADLVKELHQEVVKLKLENETLKAKLKESETGATETDPSDK
ncbi:MAG: hypothetical protein K6D96_01705 [Acetatifactor sp.]|nr:hypothetical protein [Acetatifactor sp.]